MSSAIFFVPFTPVTSRVVISSPHTFFIFLLFFIFSPSLRPYDFCQNRDMEGRGRENKRKIWRMLKSFYLNSNFDDSGLVYSSSSHYRFGMRITRTKWISFKCFCLLGRIERKKKKIELVGDDQSNRRKSRIKEWRGKEEEIDEKKETD